MPAGTALIAEVEDAVRAWWGAGRVGRGPLLLSLAELAVEFAFKTAIWE
jgi:hypothetical protein